MAGIGLFLWGCTWLYCSIKGGIENHQKMSKPSYYLKDGTPVYMDRVSNEIINGEKTYDDWYSDSNGESHWITVGSRSGKVYHDTYDDKIEREREWDEKYKQEAKKSGYTTYYGYSSKFKRRVTTEISTGKIIARLEGRPDGTYWKYYLKPDASITIEYDETKGVQITQEEYDQLNNLGCFSHATYDYIRYDYSFRHKYPQKRNKPLIEREDLPRVPGKEKPKERKITPKPYLVEDMDSIFRSDGTLDFIDG